MRIGQGLIHLFLLCLIQAVNLLGTFSHTKSTAWSAAMAAQMCQAPGRPHRLFNRLGRVPGEAGTQGHTSTLRADVPSGGRTGGINSCKAEKGDDCAAVSDWEIPAVNLAEHGAVFHRGNCARGHPCTNSRPGVGLLRGHKPNGVRRDLSGMTENMGVPVMRPLAG